MDRLGLLMAGSVSNIVSMPFALLAFAGAMRSAYAGWRRCAWVLGVLGLVNLMLPLMIVAPVSAW